ncbi:MAG: nucleotidyl transferase AbiEii/AbiGii toxin family protein [Paludibacteraceae bacterium]|nr:nucleotidyl transferase AbiEii/AbiGii toxin family protein [Paludibacteraceae bacterium]
MKSYNKNDIAIIANETGFIRDQLEKVIRLSDILRDFYANDILRNLLVLKGGTAINLTVFNMPRLSVDIDFDYSNNVGKKTMLSDRLQISSEIQSIMLANGYTLNPHTKTPHSLDSWVYGYTNVGSNHDVIKIEINYSMRCHMFSPVNTFVNVSFLEPFNINSLAPIELFGSKIKALIERCACRDVYDVNNMIQSKLFESDSERDLLRKTVLFYLCVGGNSLPAESIDVTNIKSINFSQIRAQLIPVLKKSERFDFEQAKQNVCDYLQSLMKYTDNELSFITNFNRGVYSPELLFSDAEIINNIANHPMALWKCRLKA